MQIFRNILLYLEFSGIEPVNFQEKLGFYLGGLININLDGRIRVQPELLFITQGTNVLIQNIVITDLVETFDYESSINEYAISIPNCLSIFFQ